MVKGVKGGNVFTGMGKNALASKYMVFSTIAQVFIFYSLFDGLERKIICWRVKSALLLNI